MKKSDIIEMLHDLKGAYGSKFEINDHTAPTWFKFFQDENTEIVFEAVTVHIKTETFAPSINQIYDSVKALKQKKAANENITFGMYDALI